MNTKVFLLCVAVVCFLSIDAHAQSATYQQDSKLASDFMAQLPPACSNSFMTTQPDGTIRIFIKCQGKDAASSMDGMIEIKDGLIKKIK